MTDKPVTVTPDDRELYKRLLGLAFENAANQNAGRPIVCGMQLLARHRTAHGPSQPTAGDDGPAETIDGFETGATVTPNTPDDYEQYRPATWALIEAMRTDGTTTVDHNFYTRAGLAFAAAMPSQHSDGWQAIESADTTEYARIMAWNGERMGEAVAYHEYCEQNDYDGGFVAWRWANDSCSCCWGDMNSQPILWQPLPTPPALEAAMGHGEE